MNRKRNKNNDIEVSEKDKMFSKIIMLPGFFVSGYYVLRWCLKDNWIEQNQWTGSLPLFLVCMCRLSFVVSTSIILYWFLDQDEQNSDKSSSKDIRSIFKEAWNSSYSVSILNTAIFFIPLLLFVLSFWDETIKVFGPSRTEEIPNLRSEFLISMSVMSSYFILMYFSPIYKRMFKPQLLLIYFSVLIVVLSPVSLLNYKSILPLFEVIIGWYPDDYWKWGVFFLALNLIGLVCEEVFQFSETENFSLGRPMRSFHLIQHFLSFLSILLFSIQEEHEGKFMWIVIILVIILVSGVISSLIRNLHHKDENKKSETELSVDGSARGYPLTLLQKFVATHSVSMFLLFALTIQVTSVCHSISCTTTRPLIPLNLVETMLNEEMRDSEKLSLIEAKIAGNLELNTWNLKLFVISNFNIILCCFLSLLCSYLKNELQDPLRAKILAVRVILSFLGMYVNHSDRAGHCHMVLMLALIILTAVELIHFQDDKRRVICLWKYYYYSDTFPLFKSSGIPIIKKLSLRRVHHFLTFGSFLLFGFCSFSHMIHKQLEYIGINAVKENLTTVFEAYSPIMPTFTWVAYATESFFFSSLYLYSCVAEYIPQEKMKELNKKM